MEHPPSALVAAFQGRCPRCRRGAFFTYGPYQLRHMGEHHTECPHCGLHFEPEPGFFWGAMYVNYAFIVGLFLVTFLSMELLIHRPALWLEMGVYLGLVLLLMPVFVRASRIVLLYLLAGHKFDAQLWASAARPAPSN